MKNSANEAKRMWLETYCHKDTIDYVAMDSKADYYDLFREFKRQRKVNLVTRCRENMLKSDHRKKMHIIKKSSKHLQIYKERAYRVEPIQGLVKEIFELDSCWMRGNKNNLWLFAAMV